MIIPANICFCVVFIAWFIVVLQLAVESTLNKIKHYKLLNRLSMTLDAYPACPSSHSPLPLLLYWWEGTTLKEKYYIVVYL